MLELLAPAGDMQCFNTALSCGADAVYLGLGDFNARMKAQNFDESNIKDVVEKAHFYGVKVYVTINTILQNDEINNIISLVKVAVEANVDAFLVQDLGVAKVLKECFPSIVLHASTQMGIHNLYGAKVAKSMGIKRVVLSRETKLEDIVAIKKYTDLEIEYFVQGALCISFSGNCYLSSVEQSASGNRGMCKQLCRLEYEAEIGGKKQKGHLLSARDLCLAPTIEQLAKAGVCSFKIEGRMRRAEYVGQAVRTYRKILDQVESALSLGKDIVNDKNDIENLKIAYNRGEYLSRAYLDEGVPKIVDKTHANHIGIEIGRVKDVKPFKQDLLEVFILSKREICNGDGLKFFDNAKERASLGVGDVKSLGNGVYSFVTKVKVMKNWQVNLIASSALQQDIAKQTRFVPIKMQVQAMCGHPLEISASCVGDDKIFVCRKSADNLEKATRVFMSEQDIATQCSKVGDSGFLVASCDVSTDGVFVAKSVVNALRREVVEALRNLVIANNTPKQILPNERAIQNVSSILQNSNISSGEEWTFIKSEDVFGTGIVSNKHIVLSPCIYSANEVKKIAELLDLSLEDVALELPIIANGRDLQMIEKLLADIPQIKTLVSENIYGLYFAQKGYDVIAGQGHNIANVFAVYKVKELGAKAYIPSLEYPNMASDLSLKRLSTKQNLPLMTFAHCPFKTLFGNDCNACTFKQGLKLKDSRHNHIIRRKRLSQCYFELY